MKKKKVEKKVVSPYVVVDYPASQDLFELEGFKENARLIDGEKGLSAYGVCAYLVNREWLDSEHKTIEDEVINTTDEVDVIYDDELDELGFL